MKGSIFIAATSAALAFAAASPAKIEARASSSATSSGSLPAITIKGNAFYQGNQRFYVRGIDYQPGGESQQADPLADESICTRDIAYFKQLGINTVRVYIVDNSKNHDACMTALANAGIYLALDVNNPNYSINRATPGQSYNPTYLQSVFATIDAFAGYSNLLLFFSGNEVINDNTTTPCAPYVKAVNRDMKQYIGERNYRNIPVGYSAADVSTNQYFMAQYMDCGESATRSDFYAINNYEWCDPSSFEQSGWNQQVALYGNYSEVLFLSEYGCNKAARTFAETGALYQSDMTGVFSGGLVYEYSEEDDHFGIVSISGTAVSTNDQFNALATEFAQNPAPTGDGGARASAAAQQPCPAQQPGWDTSPFSDSALPAMPSGAEIYLKNGAGPAPGLSGGSQNAAGGSSGTASAGAGSVTATYGSPSSTGSGSHTSTAAAAPLVVGEVGKAPFVITAVLALSTLFGAALL